MFDLKFSIVDREKGEGGKSFFNNAFMAWCADALAVWLYT